MSARAEAEAEARARPKNVISDRSCSIKVLGKDEIQLNVQSYN